MKTCLVSTIFILMVSSCHSPINKEDIQKEIFNTEKEFEKMSAEKGVAQAFYYFAADSAVILRDTLIKGKDKIRIYYDKESLRNARVNWTPDFIDVSECGTLAYTYGNYSWKIADSTGKISEYTGVFHTVWKKQKDNSWKYVWD